MSFNIAIDGPAGAGKSTIARAVAGKMGLIYVDTGSLYRAMALFMVREGIDLQDTGAVIRKCQEADITIRYEGGVQMVFLNGENVSGYLRTEEVGHAASFVSVIPRVREKLVELQKRLATALWMAGISAPACCPMRTGRSTSRPAARCGQGEGTMNSPQKGKAAIWRRFRRTSRSGITGICTGRLLP